MLRLSAGTLVSLLTAPFDTLAAAAKPLRTLLQPEESAGKTIGYVANAARVNPGEFPSYRRGQSCASCALVEFGTGRARGCSVVPGRLVLATAWCKLWKARAS
jgi:High potential iron-sulfur protein